jgi:hypothetical protein
MFDNFTQPRTKTSSNSYVSANIVQNCNSSKFVVQLRENNVNSVKYQILASIDGINFETLQGETVIPKDGSDYQIFEGCWRFVDVQFMSTVENSHGNLTTTISGLNK